MPNVTADSDGSFDDGQLVKSHSTPDAARNSSSGTYTSSGSLLGCMHGAVFGSEIIYRTIVSFDLSSNDDNGDSLSGNTVSSADLVMTTNPNATGFASFTANTNNLVYVCKSTENTAIDGDTYSALDGYVSSGSYDGEVTVYATANEAVSTSITFSLSSDCIADINTQIAAGGRVTMMLLCQDDFLYNVSPGGIGSPTGGAGTFKFEGVRFDAAEDSTASNRPRLELTYGAAAATDNATLFGTNF